MTSEDIKHHFIIIIQNHMPVCAVSLLESREQRYIKAMNNNNNNIINNNNMYVCICSLSLKLCTFCDVVKRVNLRKDMLFGETSLVKPESLYAYYNAMLIERMNFLDMRTSHRGNAHGFNSCH